MADDEASVVGTSPPPRKSDVLLVLARTGRLTPASTASMTRRLIRRLSPRRPHLAEHVCDAGRGQDFLVYPIVYLYRHHIELTLKSIISVACFLVDHTLTERDLSRRSRNQQD